MRTLIELREARAEKQDALQSLIAKVEAEGREMTDAEKATFDATFAEVEALDVDIERAVKLETARKQKAAPKQPERKLAEAFSFTKAIRNLAANRPLDGAELEMQQEAAREAKAAGINELSGVSLPSWMVRFGEQRTDWNVTTPADGGHTVQTTVQPIVEALRPESVLSTMGITVRQGLQGNLKFPTDTKADGAWESEVSANDAFAPTIGEVNSSPKRYGAVATISKQLLNQSTSISDDYIIRQLNRSIGNALDETGIEGGASNQPVGIIGNSSTTVLYAGAAASAGTNADGAALVWGDITKLWSAVISENVSQNNLYFLTTPGVFEKGSRTARQGSGVEGNFIFNEAMNVYGQSVKLSTLVPSDLTKGDGEDLHAMIFGNFSELALHQWGGVDIVIDPYTSATTAQVRIIANIWVDWCITRPKAFALIKDIVV